MPHGRRALLLISATIQMRLSCGRALCPSAQRGMRACMLGPAPTYVAWALPGRRSVQLCRKCLPQQLPHQVTCASTKQQCSQTGAACRQGWLGIHLC